MIDGVKRFVRQLPKNVWEKSGEEDEANDITVREYKDIGGDANYFESENSRVLVCIVNDELFYDPRCRKIWDYFWNLQKKSDEQIIFPISSELIDIKLFRGRRKDWLEHITNDLGVYELNNSEDLKKVYSIIWESVKSQEKKDRSSSLIDDREQQRNVHPINIAIPSDVKSNVWEEELLISLGDIKEKYDNLNKIGKRKYTKLSSERPILPICVIYTGGTAGNIHNEYGQIVEASKSELIANLPLIKNQSFAVDVDFLAFNPVLDSSNMGSKHWKIIAQVINELYTLYRGFVIIHGVNTMAYTASALSFMLDNICKPIILTGAELALTASHSDAGQNIQKAIEIVKAHTPKPDEEIDISILFGRRLIRGNRATKQVALDTTEGFYSPNFDELATVAHDRFVMTTSERFTSTRHKIITNSSVFKSTKRYNGNMSTKDSVAILDIYPDMNTKILLDSYLDEQIEAIILRTYGTGGVPDLDDGFLNFLEKLDEKGKIVVILTQCPKGTVEFRISETNAKLFSYGVISGGDMVTEAAYCKLKYLFDKFAGVDSSDDKKRIHAIKHYMMVNIKGELSMNMYIINAGLSGDEHIRAGSPSQFTLKHKWSNNPALELVGNEGNPATKEHFGQEKFRHDSYAEFPKDPQFASAVLRLGNVRVQVDKAKRIEEGDEKELLVNVEIHIYELDERPSEYSEFGDCHASYKGLHNINIGDIQEETGYISLKEAIDIDITNRANETLKPGNAYQIDVKTVVDDIVIGKVDILLSVRDRARMDT